MRARIGASGGHTEGTLNRRRKQQVGAQVKGKEPNRKSNAKKIPAQDRGVTRRRATKWRGDP